MNAVIIHVAFSKNYKVRMNDRLDERMNAVTILVAFAKNYKERMNEPPDE